MLTLECQSNTRIYAIGDIHGRLDLLNRLIGEIEKDARSCRGDIVVVTLGDYIDRGPDSKKVLDRLIECPFPGRYVSLKGNHESLLRSFLENPAVLDQWRRLGGLETLVSFGLRVNEVMRGQGYDKAAEELDRAISETETEFLGALELSLSIGNYFFCHAGVRPGVPLELQTEGDLLWIRDEFLQSESSFGKIIVHGHTPVELPEAHPNRINIDTGAFITGRLTAVVIENDAYRFIGD